MFIISYWFSKTHTCNGNSLYVINSINKLLFILFITWIINKYAKVNMAKMQCVHFEQIFSIFPLCSIVFYIVLLLLIIILLNIFKVIAIKITLDSYIRKLVRNIIKIIIIIIIIIIMNSIAILQQQHK